MRPWRAILLFPARPGAAAAALPRASALAAPAPPLFLLVFLTARGCGVLDAAITAAGLLALIAGLALGGALASALARRLLLDMPRRGLQVHLLFAAWAATLLFLLLFFTGSALASALALLVWGVVAGMRVLAPEAEPGRALVAACGGTAGAVIGLVLAAFPVQERMVVVMPSPDGQGTLLVRPGEVGEAEALVLAHDPAPPPKLFLAWKRPHGLEPLDPPPAGPRAGWRPLGRVFFFLGAEPPFGSAPRG